MKAVVVGVTGAVGAGKSTMAYMLANHGMRLLQADEIGHLTLTRRDVIKELVQRFGDSILGARGKVDRSALARVAFVDTHSLRKLTEVVHPVIVELLTKQIKAMRARETTPIVLEAPTLYESGCDAIVDLIVTVEATPEICETRCVTERGWTPGEATRREALKVDAEQRRLHADVVVENDGALENLQTAADQLWARIEAMPNDFRNDG